MKLYFNYAETYVEELKETGGLPMFNLSAVVKKHMNLETYVEKHFGSEYAVECDDHIYVGKKKYPIFTIDSDWKDFKGNIAIRIPNMRSEKTKALNFLRECFKKKDGEIFGLNISSLSLIENFPFDSVSVNPQQVARFKEIQLPTSKRVDTKDWVKLLKANTQISSLGYTPKELFKAEYSDLVKFNIKSYQYLVNKREKLSNGEVISHVKLKKDTTSAIKNDKMRKKAEKYGQNEIKNEEKDDVKTPMSDPIKQLEISDRGVEVKKSKMICSTCLMNGKCPDFSEGSICSRSSRWKELAIKFKTRDVTVIYEGLTDILATQSKRYARSVEFEEMSGGLIDPDVTTLENSLFKNTKELITLLKPALGGGQGGTYNIGNINVNVADAIGELNENLSEGQRQDLNGAIKELIKKRRYEDVRDSELAS